MSAKYILVNSLDVAYCATNSEGKITSTNHLFRDYVSHLKPVNISEIVHDEGELPSFIDSINRAKAQSPVPLRASVMIKQKTGAVRWNLLNIYYIINTFHFVFIPVMDAVSVMAYEYERQRALIEDCKFWVAHELLQPITSIEGLIDLLPELGETDENSEHRDIIKMLRESISKFKAASESIISKMSREQ